jgi:hypothetical protein
MQTEKPNTSLVIEHEYLMISLAKESRAIIEELGTSCGSGRGRCGGVNTSGEGDEFPHGGDEPYENIQDVKDTMMLGDSLSRICWGTNAKDNRSYYIADTGHTVTVKPKDEKSTESEPVRRIERFLEEWFKENNWKVRQSEVSHRLDRHGEAFDIVHYGMDGIVRVNFAEPTDLEDDPNSTFNDPDPENTKLPFVDMLGVRRTNDMLYRPTGYYINNDWYPDLTFSSPMGIVPDPMQLTARAAIQHRKRNVLANDPRGLTLYWPVREEMVWGKKLLSNLIRMSSFQAAFGALRVINAGMGADAVKSWLASQQSGGGQTGDHETFDMPAPSVVTTSSNVKYEFPETGKGASNHIEVLLNILRACASGMKLPEFMLTANVSEGNFASTLVSEGPFHKGMRYEQALMVQEDLRIIYQALRYAAQSGVMNLTDADIDAVVIDIKPPRVQTRNRKEDFEVNQTLWEAGELSGKEWLAAEGYERAAQQAQIAQERAAEHPLPAGSPHAAGGDGTPGPKKPKTADPMKEKGVSAGNPEQT